jgi:hypothetical protein
LRRISSELAVPEPLKSRILLEMAADLESLYDHYRARGLDEDEAARRAEERLLASPEALRHLVGVHTTLYERLLSRAVGRLRWGFDLLLFAVGVVPMLALAVLVIAAQLHTVGGTPLIWPLLLLAAGVAVISLGKAYQLFIRRERSPARLHRGLPLLVLLGALGPAMGGLVFVLGSYQVATGLAMGVLPEPVHLTAAAQVARDGTLCLLGLLLGFAAGLVWFVLVNRLAAMEQAESAALLAG